MLFRVVATSNDGIFPNRVEANAFFAVPFAQPPLGDLRFQVPPFSPRSKTRVCRKRRDSRGFLLSRSMRRNRGGKKFYRENFRPNTYCPQPAMFNSGTGNTSEDCLVLNIYAPTVGRKARNSFRSAPLSPTLYCSTSTVAAS